MVNDLRRKIKNEKLAKRVKQLVRNWKKILDQTAPVNGTPGPMHPAIAQLQSSPAVSPALSRTHAAARLVSPAQVRGKPNTPTLIGAQRCASPALLGSKSAVVGGHKGISPSMSANPPGTPASVNVQKVASPALHGGRLRAPLMPSTSDRVASPAVFGQVASPTVSGRMASPAVSGRVVSPAVSGRVASPAVSGRMVSPAVSGRMVSPAVSGRVASPAVPGRVASPAVPGRVASPAVPGRVASPAVPGRVASPAVPGRVVSPAVLGRAVSPVVSGRVVSPAVGHAKEPPSPLVATSSIQSPALRSTTPVASMFSRREDHGSVSSKYWSKARVAASSENSNSGGRVTPTSLHSDNSQDRVLGETDNGRHDSDDGSSCSSTRTGQLRYASSHNHSTSVSLPNSNNKNYGKDQRELSKTNVANRKRTREKSNSPPNEAHKKNRLESSSLSVSRHDKVINGCVSKPSKNRNKAGVDLTRGSSTSSLPSVQNISSPPMSSALSDDHAPLVHSDIFRQEGSDSRFSIQSLDRPSRDKHKVKTTEQLIEELQKKNNSANVGNSIMTKLRTNQIEKERDVPGSVLPAGVKPRGKRGRRKNDDVNLSVPSSAVMLSQVKNELVERFLKTSDPSSPVGEYSPFKEDLLPDPTVSSPEPRLELGACSSSYSKDNFDASFSASRQDRSESAPKDENSMDAISPAIPSTSQSERTGSALTLQEIYAQLPPVDDSIDWDKVDFYELPEPTPVTEDSVDRLHSEHLPGVNGLFDINGDWNSWRQTITLPSYEGNPLHILPYVDLDD